MSSENQFKLTYATMFNPPEELHTRFDAALLKVKASLGKEHAMFIEGLKIDNKNSYWLARDENEGYLGVISLNRIDSANKNAYLGIYTNPYSGKTGTGYVLIECLKRLAFNIAYLHTLKLEVIENNEKAIRFYEKSGFSEEGRLREFVFKDGKWCDVIVMGIIKRNVGQTWKSE